MSLVSDVNRRMRREAAAKARIVQRTGRYFGGFDAAEVDAVSAQELAKRVLQKFGAKVPDDEADCIDALNYFLAGAEAAGRVGWTPSTCLAAGRGRSARSTWRTRPATTLCRNTGAESDDE